MKKLAVKKATKKKPVPQDDLRIIPGADNVFIDLGFDEAEARVLLMRADLMIEMQKHITAQGWTQAEAARRMGISQPRVSKLKKQAWDKFSLDMLLTLAGRIGLRPELRIAA
jgi:predicted XRE-type DNA-binding protein